MKFVKPKIRIFDCEGDEAGGKVAIKHLDPGEVSDIIDVVTSNRVEYKKDKEGQLIPIFISEIDKRKDREETAVAAIDSWENFFDEDNNELECTNENKILALHKIEGFAGFIAECRLKLGADIFAEQRAQRKN